MSLKVDISHLLAAYTAASTIYRMLLWVGGQLLAGRMTTAMISKGVVGVEVWRCRPKDVDGM
jgi:hypothetical protein